MANKYEIKCTNCGQMFPENEIHLTAEDSGMCDDCFTEGFVSCDIHGGDVNRDEIIEVEVEGDYHNLCQHCYDNEDWETYFTANREGINTAMEKDRDEYEEIEIERDPAIDPDVDYDEISDSEYEEDNYNLDDEEDGVPPSEYIEESINVEDSYLTMLK